MHSDLGGMALIYDLYSVLLPGDLPTPYPGLISSYLEGHSPTTLYCTTSVYVNHCHCQAGSMFLLVQVWLDTEEGKA